MGKGNHEKTSKMALKYHTTASSEEHYLELAPSRAILVYK